MLLVGLYYKCADKSLAQPGRKKADVSCQNGVNFLRRLGLQGGKKNLMTARVSMLLKSHPSLTCFRACFLPGRAKDLLRIRTPVYDLEKL